MFDDFAHVWSPVMPAKKLGDELVRFTLGGEPIVLFRDAAGQPRALLDRCPHRGAALSLGRRTDTGCVECPFHGWQFDATGKAVHVPFNPDAKLEGRGATPLAVRSAGGLLWVYTAPGLDPGSEPNLPEALATPGVRATFLEADWDVHWTRAMENMLDYPHLPYVHRTTIGRDVERRMTARSKLTMGWEERPYGARITVTMDADPARDILDFLAPNGMALLLSPPPKLFRIHAFCIPTERGKTRMLIATARGFATSPLFDPMFALGNRKILAQDRAVVESSQPPEVPPAAHELSVATDRPTLAFRHYYFRRLKGTSAERARTSLLRAS